ncbi:uncharacterized protein LOC122378678 [Amphibalanus amphitrite]|uniref:uncharacterized protein LOC122378678 n=1 Tax=Amphibalanus amphitrite TaxID=1232801 RepID=UPI001C92004C|nr:uncharacterized protein LOC122378678 [Amphibalanus amphitrite]
MGASGACIPPALIFPRKRMKAELFDDAPVGTLPMISDTGFINGELFAEWLQHFQRHVKSTKDDPTLLILDNHVSHCTLKAIEFARENRIILLTLPPHGSHRLQPLDVGFFGPLKSAYALECDKWMVEHPGRCITMYNVAGLFRAAYGRVASVQKAERAFEATGVIPFNPERFGPEDFAPSAVTDRAVAASNGDEEGRPAADLENHGRPPAESEDDVCPVTGSEERGCPAANPEGDARPDGGSEERGRRTADREDQRRPVTGSVDEGLPGPSGVSPPDIYRIPKATHPQKRRRVGKKSEIMTLSPYMIAVKEATDKKSRTPSKATPSVRRRSQRVTRAKRNKSNDSDDDVCPCLVCGFAFHEAGGKKVQCISCGLYAHRECAQCTKYFECCNCASDAD